MTQSQTIPATRLWITARLSLVAMILASAVIVLSVLALASDSSAATTSTQPVAGHPCAWVNEIGPDWLPGIGAEPPC